MKMKMRRYQDDRDYWRIREFLRQIFRSNDYREFSWQVYRFDYWRWHGVENMGHGRLETDVFLWEKPDGKLGAVLNREAPGSVFLQVDPNYRSGQLEEEMVEAAEKNLTTKSADGRRRLHIWALHDDIQRQQILLKRDYIKGPQADYQRYRDLYEPIPNVELFDGYKIRSLGNEGELPARSWVSWKAFHPYEPDEGYEGWQWYLNIMRAPLYRRDFDLVAVAPDGELAAFSTVWFDDVNRTGAFEPVGTSRAHQRRGLANAIMHEGLRRLRDMGATRAFVGSWNEATHALYRSAGFENYDLLESWHKELK
jgi:GNAT superfamily N-acetyltransferase